MDITNFLKPRKNEVYSGYYRKYKEVASAYFEYEEVDMPTQTYGTVIQNLMTVQQIKRVKTSWALPFEVEGYITTHDGKMWQVQQIANDCKNSKAFKWFKTAPSCEKTLTLVYVDNPRGLR